MIINSKKLLLLVIFELLVLTKSEEIQSEARDFHGYYPPEEDKVFHYQGGFFPVKGGYSECDKNPMLPLLGKGFNFLLLKLGLFGVVKAVIALVFLGFLAKLPLLLLKFAFIKSFFLPFLAAPLLLHLFSNQMSPTSEDGKPPSKPQINDNMNMVNEENMKRELADNLTSMAWQSVKMFAESDQCVERISCIIGATTNNSTTIGTVFSKMLKHLQHSSPPSVQKKMSSIREAFNRGSRSATCTDEEYKCENPELLIQHGLTKVKII